MGLYDFQTDSTISRLARLEDSIPYLIGGGGYAQSRFGKFSSVSVDAVNGGLIDLSSASGLLVPGSIAPTVTESGFAATATTTSITWYWDGTNSSTVPIIRRTDGTRRTVPGGNQTVTGLTANTWYGFLPYWVESNQCGIGWVQGTAGTPQIAFPGGTAATFASTATLAAQSDSLAQQVFIHREQLSAGWLTYRTPAAGTSSGGGSYDPSPRCVMLNTDIETLGDLPYSSEMYPETHWYRIVTRAGRSLNCTRNHPLYDPEKKVRADELKAGDWVITCNGEEKIQEADPFIRTCTKVKVKMPTGHLFWANGFMSHNAKL